ncbi:glycine cleavage system protein H [Chitinivibrio alkaliphilus]|uniref:Glycine cleavage system protein H n=1 Tax=Chitinivibrio alkaliphilus ACht1 TaxID=1313304 RepID=U7DA61_9BACT|nr:biotin/lipoyl-containing protein [Chitinivibrio alkaliphilus]ERP39274.1 glycine cleavage system protein H [Chitinivibrio alkaliphilus ACht1]
METLWYTKQHEWVVIDGTLARVGISSHALETLGEIQYADLPEEKKNVTAGEAVATVESQKATSDVHAPLSGRIHRIHAELEEHPALINTDDTETSWIYILDEFSMEDVSKHLLTPDEYERYIA